MEILAKENLVGAKTTIADTNIIYRKKKSGN